MRRRLRPAKKASLRKKEFANVKLSPWNRAFDSTYQMLNKTTSRKFIAPRRQGAKKSIYLFSELGVLCVFARVISFRFGNSNNNVNFKHVWPVF
jgi:hypothetical protein